VYLTATSECDVRENERSSGEWVREDEDENENDSGNGKGRKAAVGHSIITTSSPVQCSIGPSVHVLVLVYRIPSKGSSSIRT
jgi:hypothetical protein